MELKFRAWDAYNGSMIDWHEPILLNKVLPLCIPYSHYKDTAGGSREYHLMQFTGLTDKNGIDIYEGDLMQNKSGRICKVVWHKYSACWDADVVIAVGDSLGGRANKWGFHMEVIGNIHQHPGLMESNCD